MNKLAQLVREVVDLYLYEENEKKHTGAPSYGYKIIDKAKAEKVKTLYAGHYIADLIDAVEEAGEEGITRGGLSKLLDIKDMKLNDDLKALSDNGVISRGRPERPEKAPSTGKRGRPKTKTDDLDGLKAAMSSEEPLDEQFRRIRKLAGLL